MKNIKKITSPQNPLVKETATLLKKRKGGEFLVEGINLLESALRPGTKAKIVKLFYTEKFEAREEEICATFIATARDRGAEIFELSSEAIERISDTGSPQGIVAVVTLKQESLFSINPEAGPVVVVDGIQDPGNLGTIIRTADASGASGVVLIDGITCDPFNPKVLRASVGSVFNFPVINESMELAIAGFKSLGCRVVVSAPEGKTMYYEADYSTPVAIVLGNEARGASREFLDIADSTVTVPLYGGAESLNVASAAAVILFESARQRDSGSL